MTHSIVHRGLEASGRVFTHPASLLAMIVFIVGWAVFEPETLDWHAAATLVTYFMAVVIERNARRDTVALHAKLDELIHATEGARNEVAHLEEETEEAIEARRR